MTLVTWPGRSSRKRLIHQGRDLAGLLEAQADRCTEMHVDLAGFDPRKEIPPEPGQQQNRRAQGNRQKYEDESAAPRHRLFQEFSIAVAKPIETLLEPCLEPAEEALRACRALSRAATCACRR